MGLVAFLDEGGDGIRAIDPLPSGARFGRVICDLRNKEVSEPALAVWVPSCVASLEEIRYFFCSLDTSDALRLLGVSLCFMVANEVCVVAGAERACFGLLHDHCFKFCLVLKESNTTCAERVGEEVANVAEFDFGHVDLVAEVHSTSVGADREFEEPFNVLKAGDLWGVGCWWIPLES